MFGCVSAIPVAAEDILRIVPERHARSALKSTAAALCLSTSVQIPFPITGCVETLKLRSVLPQYISGRHYKINASGTRHAACIFVLFSANPSGAGVRIRIWFPEEAAGTLVRPAQTCLGAALPPIAVCAPDIVAFDVCSIPSQLVPVLTIIRRAAAFLRKTSMKISTVGIT
jgi:hypothetical protein